MNIFQKALGAATKSITTSVERQFSSAVKRVTGGKVRVSLNLAKKPGRRR